MLFNRYDLYKNHGEFVHLNMLKWALKYVPELGEKTVPRDETVKSMEIGTGGVDITTSKDSTGEEKSKHVPYTDLQVNGSSQPTFNLQTYGNNEARWNPTTGVAFDRYTKVVDYNNPNSNPVSGISLYDKDTVNVDGHEHNYITKVKYYNRDDNGALNDAGQDKEFKPYTSVVRDDNSLASQVKIKHDDQNHFTGASFPATGEDYNVEVTKATLFNFVYPVGSIYMSVNEVDPSTLFGGTWEKLENRFLLGATESAPLGSTGGDWVRTLTQANMPNYEIGQIPAVVPSIHSNWNNAGVKGKTLGQASPQKNGVDLAQGNLITSGNQYGWSISTNGGGQSFNITPPYLAVNMWKRTA